MKKTFWAASALLAVLVSCGGPSAFENSGEYPDIFPDYVGVTVPEGMAELRFQMADGRAFKAETTREGDVQWVTVKAWEKGARTGTAYKPFPIYISQDAIDPYIAYRLIEPGYESWHDISICQRDLSGFRESRIVDNRANNKGCINCHTFYGGDPQKMLFHARGAGGGTVFVSGDEVKLINLAAIGPGKQGTYPAWHPGGRYIAFSSNTTRQVFTLADDQPIEVYDTASDIILMDLQTDSVYLCPALTGEAVLETFPAWSEDGGTLYYCAAENPGEIISQRGKVHYKLMSIGFENGAFTGEPQVVWADSTGSASFPRVRDGKLLFTRSGFGTFPIWHREADLYMLDLSGGEVSAVEELNSPEADSYHSWSSNGKWVVFSSRRLDGRYTRLYLAHYRGDGHFDKPFLLPQEDPAENQLRVKSYNLPEFLTAPSPSRQKETAKLFAR
jgi:hypothetical protein